MFAGFVLGFIVCALCCVALFYPKYGPAHVFGDIYVVRDTSIPNDYPPLARDELVRRRLETAP